MSPSEYCSSQFSFDLVFCFLPPHSFHTHIAPSFYGYNLQLGEFPYDPAGPGKITPFILAVQCLLAAEHLPQYNNTIPFLAEEVLNILLYNPAKSWQAPNSTPSNQQEGLSQSLVAAFATETEGEILATDPSFDPEYGLGPEEIVAACLLAGYISAREKVLIIAKCAFLWARGWLDVSEPVWT
jgi:hypothetical protein